MRGRRADRPSLLTSLRHRDYRLFIGAFTTSSIGSWAYNVALAVWLIDETGSSGLGGGGHGCSLRPRTRW